MKLFYAAMKGKINHESASIQKETSHEYLVICSGGWFFCRINMGGCKGAFLLHEIYYGTSRIFNGAFL
ncbi:hypothetical protein D3C80_1183160 [compost metagenome]